MGRAIGTACAVLLGLTATPAVTRAQTDYRNLDDGRPVRTEDAFVVDHHEFEVLAPFIYDAGIGGSGRYIVQPELEYGLWSNWQLSMKVPAGVADSAGSDVGLGTGKGKALSGHSRRGPGTSKHSDDQAGKEHRPSEQGLVRNIEEAWNRHLSRDGDTAHA